MFLDLNGWQWSPDPPDVNESESAMLAVASKQWSETELAA